MKVPRYRSLKPLVPWRELTRPIDWASVFGRDQAMHVEIGFGNGEFLSRKAKEHPNQNFVGIEMEWELIQRGLRRINQEQLQNVRLIQADAREVFWRAFAPHSISCAYSLFPCPWPKKRHIKHRLFSKAFLSLLNSRLRASGELRIVTDTRHYVEWILQETQGTGFKACLDSTPPRFDTKYERKWFAQGQRLFYDLRLSKRNHLEIAAKEDLELRTHKVDQFDPARFAPANERRPFTIEFKEFLYDGQRRKGMVRVLVVEEDLSQEVWIEVARSEERWHIRPARGCRTIPTAGIQRTLDLIHEHICEQSKPEK